MKPACLFAAAAAVLAAAGGVVAAPVTINLSTDSSDSTPASLLNASFTFDIVGSTLSLVVQNNTNTNPGGQSFQMDAAYFNAPAGVSLSAFSGPSDWSYLTNQAADGFGSFRFAVVADNPPANFLLAGGAFTFTWTVSGTSDPMDFVTELSTIPPGSKPRNAAAKFVRGVGDDSAFGAGGVLIPLPSAAMMAAGGLVLTLPMRRRRRA